VYAIFSVVVVAEVAYNLPSCLFLKEVFVL
jgi:hypothetical protein